VWRSQLPEIAKIVLVGLDDFLRPLCLSAQGWPTRYRPNPAIQIEDPTRKELRR